MEEMILEAGDTLNGRIEQERVRQMLFLGPTQHVALHFKVTKDHELFFIYASVVSEKDVILQTRPQLLMGDPCMTEPLPGAALLPGGTDMKAIAYKGPPPGSERRDMSFDRPVDEEMDEADRDYQRLLQRGDFAPEQGRGDRSLPPLRGRGEAVRGERSDRRIQSARRPAQDKAVVDYTPRMQYNFPQYPDAPYRIVDPPREEDALGRPCCNLDSLKKPLIFPTSARAILQPNSARTAGNTTRSEPGGYRDGSGFPPRAPDTWSSGPVNPTGP
jgi:hypothetical protein